MHKKFLTGIKQFWIPHAGNEHQPLVLVSKSLRCYAYFLISLKVIVTLILFSFYPSPGFLALETQDKIIELINQTRQEKGLTNLRADQVLTRAAEAKAQDMIDKDYFSHTSPDGSHSWEWVNRDKYYYLAFGENLAMDFASAQTAHVALMNSPSHAKNILNVKYHDIGIGVAAGEMAGRETIVLVQFFGLAKEGGIVDGLGLITQKPKNQRTEEQKIVVAPLKEMVGSNVVSQKLLAEELPQEEVYLDQNLTSVSPVIVRVAETEQAKDFLNRIILYSDWLLWGFLIFLVASLLINIFVEIKIQKPVLIGQSIFTILIVLSLLLFKVHFIEEIYNRVISIL